MKLLENWLNNQPWSCWWMLSFEWRYMTIWRRANVTIFQYMTLWLSFIASILNILSSHYTLLKSFLYAAHYKNNKTLSNCGRKHSRSKSHNKERCQMRGGGVGWGLQRSWEMPQSYIRGVRGRSGWWQSKHSPFDAVKSMATVKWIWVLKEMSDGKDPVKQKAAKHAA